MEYPATRHFVSGLPESTLPVGIRVVAGHVRQGSAYRTWRENGTDDWLIICTASGAGRVSNRSGASIELSAGDAVLFRPRDFHDYGTDAGEEWWDIAFAHFHPKPEWLPMLSWPTSSAGVGHIRLGGGLNRRVIECLDRAVRLGSGILPTAEQFAMNALEEAILWIDTQNPGQRRTDERLLAALDYVAGNLSRSLSVADVAAAVHLSPSRLSHLFAAQLGLSPQRYVERQRLVTAQHLLSFTGWSIAKIAAEVGFRDPLYFSQRFRRFTGVSPTAYRTSWEAGVRGVGSDRG